MAQILYFLPTGPRTVTVPQLEAKGLGHVFNEKRPSLHRVWSNKGPCDAGAGLVVADATVDDATLVGYYADQQTWGKAPGQSWWVGYNNKDVPGPGDLRRDWMLAGKDLLLADGNMWHVPVARAWQMVAGVPIGINAIPTRSKLGDGGWVPGEVLPEYQPLWQIAEAYFCATVEKDTEVADTFESFHVNAVTALAANYRIGPAEASLLGVLTLPLAVEIHQILIDSHTLKEWAEKKNAAGGGDSSSPGPPDEPQDTPQHRPICGDSPKGCIT